MAIRVTATEVKDIMDDCQVGDAIVDTFILVASAVVDSVFTNDTTTSTTLLKEIERWYSAHLVASTLERYTLEEDIGAAKIIYAAKMGEGFKSTPYGQALLQIDTTGKMAKLGKKGVSLYAIVSFD